MIHPLAGKPVPQSLWINIPKLLADYYLRHPDVSEPSHRVVFGTSGHRGSSCLCSFNEDHILAITEALCLYREKEGIKGPLFLGMDTHALSEPAHSTALEVLAAHDIDVMIHKDSGFTPTPVISHAILNHNRKGGSGTSDGIVVTPSHNPPDSGGFKYNPPAGGPADTAITGWIADAANRILENKNREVKRIPYGRAIKAATTHHYDFVTPFVRDLENILDMEVIRSSGVRICADAMGGSGMDYWEPLADHYGLNMDVVNRVYDPAFRFMTLDRDGKIRMDCSSAYAMAGLIKLKDSYDIAFGNDPDFDRHGIVTRSGGLMNPNHFLSVAVWYLFQERKCWPEDAAIGKTLVSSSMIDRIASGLGKRLFETPVGFKWFVEGLLGGTCAFGGEESAGATFLRKDGTVWTTDKDGFIMALLAAEITAKTGRDPSEHYLHLEERFGSPIYERMDAPADREEKELLQGLSPDDVAACELAGEKIIAKLSKAPGNNSPIGGLKVVTENGWFAARPSGTEDIYKIYSESFRGEEHLKLIQEEAKDIIATALKGNQPSG